MKHLTQAEYDALVAAREERDSLARLITSAADGDVHAAASAFARSCRAQGFVITIEQKPLEPLAMGNHVDVVTVRPVRVMAERIVR